MPLFRVLPLTGVQDSADRHWLSTPARRIIAGVADDKICER